MAEVAIKAAIPYIRPSYKPKKIIWKDSANYKVCSTQFGDYVISWNDDETEYKVHYPDSGIRKFTGELAKWKAETAAQSDFNARLHLCIERYDVDNNLQNKINNLIELVDWLEKDSSNIELLLCDIDVKKVSKLKELLEGI